MNRIEKMLKSHIRDNNKRIPISGSVFDDYFKKIQNNNTPHLLESNGMSVDVFSKLLEDRIIFLSTEIAAFANARPTWRAAQMKMTLYLSDRPIGLKVFPVPVGAI